MNSMSAYYGYIFEVSNFYDFIFWDTFGDWKFNAEQ